MRLVLHYIALLSLFWAVQAQEREVFPLIPKDFQREPAEDNSKTNPQSFTGCTVYRLNVVESSQVKRLQALADNPQLRLEFWSQPTLKKGSSTDVMACAEAKETLMDYVKSAKISSVVYVADVGSQLVTEKVTLDSSAASAIKNILFIPTIGNYVSTSWIHTYMNWLASAYSSRASVFNIGTSIEGRNLKVIRVHNGDGKTRKAIFVEAGIHAREWLSPASTMYIIDKLVRQGATDTQAKNMLSRYDWYFIPVANPDGYEYTRSTDRMWRKNRKVNTGSSCRGVDLNRNWQANFGGVGASNSPCSDTYHGTAQFSEPESRAIKDFLATKPGEWAMYLAVHTYSQLWLTPFAYTESDPADDAALKEAGQVGVDAIHDIHSKTYTLQNGHDLYLASGTSMDWAKLTLNIKYSYTLELRPASSAGGGFIVPKTEIIPTGQEIFNAFDKVSAKIFGCFSPFSEVWLEAGVTKQLKNLVPGDRVLSVNRGGDMLFSDVITFFHFDTNNPREFLKIELDNGKSLSLTPNHLIFASKTGINVEQFVHSVAVFAGDLKVGDIVYTTQAQAVNGSRISRISSEIVEGAVAPLTASGTIVVDDVVASCYASFPSHALSHLSMLPLRLYHSVKQILPQKQVSFAGTFDQGIHPYAQFLFDTVSRFGIV